MADYWRFSDRAPPLSVPPKRPRAEHEDIPPGTGILQSEEPRYDGRDGRFSWREPESLGFGGNMNAYGSGGAISGSDMVGFGGGGQPFSSINPSSNLGLPNMGLSSLNGPQGGQIPGGSDRGILKPPQMSGGGRLDYHHGHDSLLGGPAGLGVVPPDATPTLYVEGIPSDCTRREAAHIFRPFVGFKDIRLVRKDAKRPGGDQFTLCFVDFTDPKCASIALEALQGYKFDETDGSSEMLRLQYSRFPGTRPPSRDIPGPREAPQGGRGRGRGRGRDSFNSNRPFRH